MKIVIEYLTNTSHMTATAMSQDPEFEEICEIVAPIAKKHGVTSIYLFGSRARGDSRTDSDFDFYIVPGRIRTLTKLCGLLCDLEDALGKGVDLITEEPSLNEDFSKEVLRDRKLVYGS